MWIVAGFVGILALAWIVRLAVNPVGTAVNTVRVLLFLAALAVFLLWLTLSDKQDPSHYEALWFAIILAGLWLLTFILPAIVRTLIRRRK
ncbi:hypothetical protein QMQ05_02175 [Glutamicibacter ectropisis]|uniref:Uncharacterized protein n=1 Tax=Glutamicibacter ectropisis TaxID=3046593 RepID=A0AAU6WEH0_9MICC